MVEKAPRLTEEVMVSELQRRVSLSPEREAVRPRTIVVRNGLVVKVTRRLYNKATGRDGERRRATGA